MATLRICLLAGALVLLAACGSVTQPPAADEGKDGTAADVQIVEPGTEVVAHGLLMQADPDVDAPVEICVGGVAESYPPQCGGPVLRGEFSWDEVDPERASGVTWTTDPWYAVGTYDPDDGPQGSLTLTRPVSIDPPDGLAVPTPGDVHTFPQLCDDPFRDGGVDGAGDLAAQEALAAELEDLDGYVTSWVSDGSSLFNVIVTADTDPQAVHARLRGVWRGGLCVEARDLPTQQQVRDAQQALGEEWDTLRLLSSGGGGTSGLLEVEVVLTDRATVNRIREVVAPWLTPAQVRVSGALRPLDAP